MKNFDDFVKHVNESELVQSTLSDVEMNLKTASLSLANPEDVSEVISAVQEQTLNQFMQILRAYHEWTTEK